MVEIMWLVAKLVVNFFFIVIDAHHKTCGKNL